MNLNWRKRRAAKPTFYSSHYRTFPFAPPSSAEWWLPADALWCRRPFLWILSSPSLASSASFASDFPLRYYPGRSRGEKFEWRLKK
jgi:hypothetical protein